LIFPNLGNIFFIKWTYTFVEAKNSNFGLKIFKIKNQPKIGTHLISYSLKGVYLDFQKIWISRSEKISKKGVDLYLCGAVYNVLTS